MFAGFCLVRRVLIACAESRRKKSQCDVTLRIMWHRILRTIWHNRDPKNKICKKSGLRTPSPFHFFRVFKEATGMKPLQFVTREGILLAQQLIRETSRSLIENVLEIGYASPSHLAQVFGRTVGIAPAEFRALLE
jgi:AraC-like DNA-binding protein